MCKIEENEKNNSRVLIDWIKTLSMYDVKSKGRLQYFWKTYFRKTTRMVTFGVCSSSKFQCSGVIPISFRASTHSLCNILIQWKKSFSLFLPCYYLAIDLGAHNLVTLELHWEEASENYRFFTKWYILCPP